MDAPAVSPGPDAGLGTIAIGGELSATIASGVAGVIDKASAADGQVATWDAATGKFKPKAAAGGSLNVKAIAYDRGRRALAETDGRRAETGEPVTVATPTTAATAISGGVVVDAWDFANSRPNTSIRTLRAKPAQDDPNFPRRSYIRADKTLTTALTPTYAVASAPVFEFDYTGAAIDLLIRQGATTGFDAQADIFIDGKLAYSLTQAIAAASGAGSGVVFRVPLTFVSNRQRRISIHFKAASAVFAGWVREAAATSSYPNSGTKGPKVIVAGDSFGEGGSALPSGLPFVQWLGYMMGWADIHNASAGSTGYYTPGTRVALKDRYQNDVINQAPNIVVIPLGINDLAAFEANNDNVWNAATTAWDAIIAALPSTELVIIGPFFPRGGSGLPASMVAMDNGLKERALARGLRYISPIAEAWITGTGKEGAPAGNGNADIYISSDGTHPTPAGHKYLAWRIAGHLLTPVGAAT